MVYVLKGRKNMLKKRYLVAGALSALTAMPLVGYAEDVNTFELDEYVVTADRIGGKEKELNVSTSVITSETLEKQHVSTVGQALNRLPGVSVRNKGITGAAYVDNEIYINGSPNVLLLVDGKRMNQQGNSNELFSTATLIGIDNIERIEVVRGAASTLYGSEAEGGVINIITKKKKQDGVNTSIGVQGGSYSQYAYKVNHMGRQNGYFWNVSGLQSHSSEFKEATGRKIPESVTSKNLDLKVGKDFDVKGSIAVSYSRYDSDSHWVKPVAGKDLETLAKKIGKRMQTKYGVDWTYNFSDKLSNNFTYMFNNHDFRNDMYGTLNAMGIYDVHTTDINDYLTWKFDKSNALLVGYNYTKDKLAYMFYSQENYTGISFSNDALYAQYKWNITPELNVTAGIRHDDNSQFGTHNSKSYTAGYAINDKTNVYANYGEFFVAPRVVQVYSSKWGNKDLKPEYGHNIEMGVNHIFNQDSQMKLSVYRRSAKDRIGLKKIPPSTQSIYVNFDNEKTHGANVEIATKLFKDFKVNAGYSYVYVKAQEGANPNRNGYLPRSEWKLNFDYDTDKVDYNLCGRGTIRRDGRLKDNVDKKATTFWVWDANITYKATPKCNVFLQVNNIFNQDYTERVYTLDPDVWYAAPGRHFVVGVDYKF